MEGGTDRPNRIGTGSGVRQAMAGTPLPASGKRKRELARPEPAGRGQLSDVQGSIFAGQHER